MLSTFVVMATLGQTTVGITRDRYDVPVITASSKIDAYRLAGYACAEDRMWQMELSRRAAQGRMAEALGPKFIESDREYLRQGYSRTEIQRQIDGLSPIIQAYFNAYADGVNQFLTKGNLPPEYAQNDLKPLPWTSVDSAAIAIKLLQTFGRGGSGEIRNLALLEYLKTQKNLKGKELDLLDDLAWQNDLRAQTTVSLKDDLGKPFSQPFTRKDTERQLDHLPKLNLFELLPLVRVATREVSTKVAEAIGSPYKSGSYCIVVSPARSANGKPMLLSGPQMGFTDPSIVHEMALHAPGLDVAGMDLPGVPGVLVGATPSMAWGITTGVADMEDIYVIGKNRPVSSIEMELPVKGQKTLSVTQKRSALGVVIAEHKKSESFFVRRRSYEGTELRSLESNFTFAELQQPTAQKVDHAIRNVSMNFNAFFALKSGEIGWRYTGQVPMRPEGIDPRFPVPDRPENQWQGLKPLEDMPHTLNPSTGIITNWNNKPTPWWPNLDTPAWGKGFRNEVLNVELRNPKLTVADVERAAWTIARKSEDWETLGPIFQKAAQGTSVQGFDGWLLQGSFGGLVYSRWVQELRETLFMPVTGNFASPENFRLVTGTTTILNALQGKTKVSILGNRKADTVAKEALIKVLQTPNLDTGYQPGTIPVPGEEGIPYRNRGTYIQVIELSDTVRGRNVLPLGVKTGTKNQAALSRQWTYKPMHIHP